MTKGIIYLAIFIDKYNVNNNFYILDRFSDVSILDNFTGKFNDTNEIREYYKQDISEFFIDNIDVIKRNETKNNEFRGRIAAFYLDDNNEKVFLEVKYKNKNVVRDYLNFNTFDYSYNFVKTVIDTAIKKINNSGKLFKTSDKVKIVNNTLLKFNFKMTGEERNYLKNYFYSINVRKINGMEDLYNPKYEALMYVIRTNMKRSWHLKEAKEMEEFYHKKKLDVDDNADEFLKYNIDDDENLFLNHDIDEIEKYTNKIRRK